MYSDAAEARVKIQRDIANIALTHLETTEAALEAAQAEVKRAETRELTALRERDVAQAEVAGYKEYVDEMSKQAKFAQAISKQLAEALEAIRNEIWSECHCNEGYTSRNLIDPSCQYHDFIHVLPAADAALAAYKETTETGESPS